MKRHLMLAMAGFTAMGCGRKAADRGLPLPSPPRVLVPVYQPNSRRPVGFIEMPAPSVNGGFPGKEPGEGLKRPMATVAELERLAELEASRRAAAPPAP